MRSPGHWPMLCKSMVMAVGGAPSLTMAQTQVPIKSKELHPRPMQLRFKAIQVMVALRKECNPSSRQPKCKVTQVMVTLQECNLLLRSKALLIMVPLKEFNVLLKAQAIQCMVALQECMLLPKLKDMQLRLKPTA